MAAPILSNVGDIIIILGSVVPAGYLSLGEGTEVNRTEYADLWSWAQSNTTVISESEWQRENTSHGTVAKFSSGNGSTTFRLPKITSILKAVALADAGKFNEAVFNDVHYHGLGKMRNNNGYWGRYSYSGATYPSGTAAWFWNGRGGNGTGTTPDAAGDIITSLNIGGSSEPPSPATVGVTLCIRYTTDYQATATALNTAALATSVNSLVSTMSDVATAYNVTRQLGTNGYQVYESGLIKNWGRTDKGQGEGVIVFSLAFKEGTSPYNIKTTVVDPSGSLDGSGTVILGEPTNASVSYKYTKVLPADAYIMWEAYGTN